jgi:sporadic carbohydrate cluster 2OG-Fe(II) oxygenase
MPDFGPTLINTFLMSDLISLKRGYAVVNADQPSHLEDLRKNIFSLARAIFQLPNYPPEHGFNSFHREVHMLSPGELNERRIELIQRVTAEYNVAEVIFRAFETNLRNLLGPDILAQKNANLVLQIPGDLNPSELHRDAPANSPYELVVWVPLVNCYGTKAMYILDISDTEKALHYMEENPNNWEGFESFAKSLSETPKINFGQALMFFTGCLHGSDVNTENETRVSLNVRYKNLFSPSGLKNQLQFFRPLRISEIARFGASFESQELLK